MLDKYEEVRGYKGANDPSIDPMKVTKQLIWIKESVEGPYGFTYEPGFHYPDKEDLTNYYLCFGHGAYWAIDKKVCEKAYRVPVTITWDMPEIKAEPYPIMQEAGYMPENKGHKGYITLGDIGLI